MKYYSAKSLWLFGFLSSLFWSGLTSAQLIEAEPNNSPAQASLGALGASISGQFSIRYPSTGFDNDYIAFTEVEAGRLSFELSTGGTSCCDYTYFEVSDSEGNLLSADRVQEGTSENWEVAVTGGTYFLRLFGDTDDGYSFVMTNPSGYNGLETEPNNNFANLLVLGTPRFGQFHTKYAATNYDNDFFYFSGDEGSAVDVTLAAGGTSCCDYVYFQVLNQEGDVLSGGRVQEGNSATLPVNLSGSSSGYYFVRTYGDTDDYYSVLVEEAEPLFVVEAENNNSATSADLIPNNTLVVGQFHTRYALAGYDNDYFAFETTSSGVITLEVLTTGTSCCDYVYVEVYDQLGNLLFGDRVTEGDTNSWPIGIGAAGNYFVRLYGDTRNLYGVSVAGSIISGIPSKPIISDIEETDGALGVSGSMASGGPVSNYVAECGGLSATSESLPVFVDGLVNGTEYSCTLTANSRFGSSEPSDPVFATPRGVPTSVQIENIDVGDGELVVTVLANLAGGENPTYSVICNGIEGSASTNRVTVGGLENGTTYSCVASVSTEYGGSEASSPVTAAPEFIPQGLPIWLLFEASKT